MFDSELEISQKSPNRNKKRISGGDGGEKLKWHNKLFSCIDFMDFDETNFGSNVDFELKIWGGKLEDEGEGEYLCHMMKSSLRKISSDCVLESKFLSKFSSFRYISLNWRGWSTVNKKLESKRVCLIFTKIIKVRVESSHPLTDGLNVRWARGK